MKQFAIGRVAALLLAGAAAAEYEIGGPLAGVKLPPFPTQHGERPGYPGWFDPQGSNDGLPPEVELYPGAVEHFRAYWFKYCPVRSSYDAQSQLRNWTAPTIPGAQAAEDYAAPVYRGMRHGNSERTDKFWAPVPVVRCRPQGPVIQLDLGELDAGLYALRVIGAVETKDIRPFSKALFLKAAINDGLKGETTVSRQRLGYVDEFYSVAEIYFHAVERRRYQATLQVDAGSEVDLLVHNITLDDCLAGTVKRAIKSRAIRRPNPGVQVSAPKVSAAERLARDAALWEGFPPLNYQSGRIPESGYGAIPGVAPGTDRMTGKEIVEQYGDWGNAGDPALLMVNRKLGLRYTMEDYRARRPLPDPYPFKDDGLGLTFPDAQNPAQGRVWAPIAAVLEDRVRRYMTAFHQGAEDWIAKGDSDAAHDAAVQLVRFAYAFPAIEDSSTLHAVLHDPGAFNRGHRCRSRETCGQALGHFSFQFRLHGDYDSLYTYIAASETLAQSVGRFVPWVKSPRDVVQLLDVYLLQVHAKRHLRYQYYGDGREPAVLSEIAAVLGDNAVTDPWMEWLFSRAFYYPRPLAGLPDFMVSAMDRDGRGTIGSSSYVMGDECAATIARSVEGYIENGGNPRFNLCDFTRFPKALTALYFPIRAHSAGLWTMRIGSVSGPDKGYAKAWRTLVGEDTALAWKWTRDPAFAYILRHYGKKEEFSEQEWTDMDRAATALRRAPWMDNPSRVLPNYAAFLETGLEHDDMRFRRSVMLRVGTGSGHAHQDTLDMQINAHGLPMTIEAGQRPGYSAPNDARTYVHNTVQVDGKDWPSDHVGGTNSWVRTLTDMEGARYMAAQVAANPLATYARRQVALIDVDEGRGSQRLGPDAFGPKPENLPKDVVTPNSYVFDVFRVAGGRIHTYCFHAHVNDLPCAEGNFQPRTNAEAVAPALPDSPEGQYLKDLANQKYAGVAPEHFAATFRLQKERVGVPVTRSVHRAGAESFLAGFIYDPNAPDKFTRLHVLGAAGAVVMKGDLNCKQWNYFIPNIYVQRRGEALESAFAAVVEPFSGRPFIEEIARLKIGANEEDAQQAVALRVKTANGRTDVCFADGRPEKARDLPEVACRMSGEFAYYSADATGLRQLALTGGRTLRTPMGGIALATGEHRAKIVRADYRARKVWTDSPWPAGALPRQVELKTQPSDDARAWQTSFTTTTISGTEIAFLHSADFYRAAISGVHEAGRAVTCALPVPLQASGFRRGWTASNDDASKLWRVTEARGSSFTLAGAVAAGDFGPENALRVWEYGVGDELRLSAFAVLRRIEPGLFEFSADADAALLLPFAGVEWSADRTQWRALPVRKIEGLSEVQVKIADLPPGGKVYLRVK